MSVERAGSTSWRCGACGELHDELPFSYHSPAPASWEPELEDDPDSELGEEQSIVRGEYFFLRGLIRIPVLDDDRPFDWGVWVSLSAESMQAVTESWMREGREHDPPRFGWLNTFLPYEPPTGGLPADVRTRPVGQRPLIELHPGDHPLIAEQREGITLARVQELAELLLHP